MTLTMDINEGKYKKLGIIMYKIRIIYSIICTMMFFTNNCVAQSLFPFLNGTPTVKPTIAYHKHINRWGLTLRDNVYIRSEPMQTGTFFDIIKKEGEYVWVEAEFFTDDGFSWYEIQTFYNIHGYIRSDLLKVMSQEESDSFIYPADIIPQMTNLDNKHYQDSLFPFLPSKTPTLTPDITITPTISLTPTYNIPNIVIASSDSYSEYNWDELLLDDDIEFTEIEIIKIKCDKCGGEGICQECKNSNGRYKYNNNIPCPLCRGTKKCIYCKGTGYREY